MCSNLPATANGAETFQRQMIRPQPPPHPPFLRKNKAVGDEGQKVGVIIRGQTRMGRDGGAGDHGIDAQASFPPHPIEQAGGLVGLLLADHVARQC